MKHFNIFIFSLILVSSEIASSQTLEQKPTDTKPNINKEITLIQSADYIIQNYGNTIWENIDNTPLRILLISDSLEFLFNHNNPSEEFEFYKYDSLLKTKIYARKKVFPPFLRATFPAVNGQDCIVVGTPKNTKKTNEDWIITILHEHFHLYQGENNQYKNNLKELTKKISSESKNWMLEYDFPYDNEESRKLFKKLVAAINEAFLSIDKNNFQEKIHQCKIEQTEFKNLLSSNDFDYFAFQIWQEGIATYTESKYLAILNKNNDLIKKTTELDFCSKDILHLTGYREYLLKSDLQKEKRELFYALGLLQGLINDKLNPTWKVDYFEDFYSPIFLPENVTD